MSDYHDYKENLAFPPIGSQDDLNEQGRDSEVLIKAIEKCERLGKENQQLKELLRRCKYPVILAFNRATEDDADEYCKLWDEIDEAIGEKK